MSYQETLADLLAKLEDTIRADTKNLTENGQADLIGAIEQIQAYLEIIGQ